RRWGAAALALAPWALAYALLSAMPEPGGARELRLAWEGALPLAGWTVWIYSAAYPLALAAPLLIDRRRDLRRFVLSAWGITLAGFAAMLLLPGRAALLPVPATGAPAWLFSANRALDAEWLACPSFHAAWSVLAACAIADRRPRLRWPAAALAFLVCASCLTTGSHALADVAAGALLGVAAWHQGALWRRMVGAAERLANAWSAVQVGPVRVIGHAPWSALAAAAGMLVVVRLSGPERIPAAAAVFAAGLLAAGAWGHVLEGGGRLSRPFGYYGFLFGALAALAGLAAFDAGGALRLAAAFAVGAPLAQALGRLRCLVQGCCHGRPARSVPGLRVIHPMSRVTALAGLRGVAIHPTQLYSLVGNLAVFAVLARLWEAGTPANFVGGAYLLLSSQVRFVEEQYRGEPQTPVRCGLAVYQWLAVGVFVAGILVTMLAGPGVAAAAPLTTGGVLLSGAAGLCAALFMSVDFPGSRRRFSRLTVGSPE
ncbi:MAG: prolipoprotein diacylglyceryl transferase, partial [Rhodocyclaceae bacterium]|nr:prolipoprotein diacylglyceryl transferase [Rhodocyclaceae bacterium]